MSTLVMQYLLHVPNQTEPNQEHVCNLYSKFKLHWCSVKLQLKYWHYSGWRYSRNCTSLYFHLVLSIIRPLLEILTPSLKRPYICIYKVCRVLHVCLFSRIKTKIKEFILYLTREKMRIKKHLAFCLTH